MGRREESQKLKRERIVAAAKALFSKHGHEATTTRAIARRARIAHGTLFLYARTKADVVLLVFESEIGEAVSRALTSLPLHTTTTATTTTAVTAVTATALTDFCLHFYGAFVGVYARDPSLARVLVKELPWLEGPSRAAMMSLTFDVLGAIAARVQAAKDTGFVDDDVDPLLFSQASFSLYMGALTAWLGGELGDPAGEGRTTALALLRAGHVLLEKGTRRWPPQSTSTKPP